MLNFVDSELKEKQIPNEYFDSLIPDSGVNYERIVKIFKCSVETVQLEISEEDVVDLYKRNKKNK